MPRYLRSICRNSGSSAMRRNGLWSTGGSGTATTCRSVAGLVAMAGMTIMAKSNNCLSQVRTFSATDSELRFSMRPMTSSR